MTSPLRFASFLALDLLPFYRWIASYVGRTLGLKVECHQGMSYADAPSYDAIFLCGLAYVELHRAGLALEPVAAPIPWGAPGGRAEYDSVVVVRHDSRWRDFADLRGCRWAYNEPFSQSGFGVVRSYLGLLGEDASYFGKAMESGSHRRSLELLASGRIDSAAIDSHLLAFWERRTSIRLPRVRIVARLGPSPIQPLVVTPRLTPRGRDAIRQALVNAYRVSQASRWLDWALIQRYTAVGPDHYESLRRDVGRIACSGGIAPPERRPCPEGLS
jgi:phosphonate transport system substrate-binding protein